MKKVIGLFGILVLMMLVACGGTSGETAVIVSEDSAQLNDSFEDALSIQAQLAIGTILLEDDALAVDADQAAKLLPLWNGLQGMEASGTAADAELTAVVNQIQATMTTAQIVAIAEMDLTQEAMRTLIADGVIEVEARGDRGADGGGAPAGGGALGGGGRPGGGAPGAGGQVDPAQQATREAARGGGGANFLSQAVTGAVVQMLEGKVEG